MRPASYSDVDLIERLCEAIESGVFVTIALEAEGWNRNSYGDWRKAAEREEADGVEMEPGTARWASDRIARARARAIGGAMRDMYAAETGHQSGRDWRSIHKWVSLAAPEEMGDRQTVTVETRNPTEAAAALLGKLSKD